ncbi:MAG: glycosyltransferase [Acidobacteriia bacterium]|nr:glycosyltransferase [Terriglobia bacterium]
MCLALHYPRRCGGLNPLRALEMYRSQSRRNACLPQYESILVASTAMQHEFARHGIQNDKLHLVPLPNLDARPGVRLPEARPLAENILFVGRLTDLKGVDYLIRAVPKAAERLARPLRLTIAGDGPGRTWLQELAARLSVPAHFSGWLQPDAKYEAMRQADLLAVPSLWPEPFGLVGIEAGSMGLPAVGFAVGGIPDWLLAGRTGEIAPGDPPSVGGLADAIVRALQDRTHYLQLRREAFQASRRFTLEVHMAQLETLFGKAARHAAPLQPRLANLTI